MTSTPLRAAAWAPALLSLWLCADPLHAAAPPPVDTPYPGTLTLQVDATDLDRRIVRVKETVPVQPGKLTLYYPQWLPGNHGPNGRIGELAGLMITAGGQPIAWKRNTLDTYAFEVDVPAGVRTLALEFQFLSPVDRETGRVVITPEMLNLQWNSVLLYPAGHYDRRITVQPSLRLPDGWKLGTALETSAQSGPVTDFKPVSVETLIDSPVYAGKYMSRIDLDPEAAAAGRSPVFLNVMADTAAELATTPEQLAAHRALVTQADRLYGARHYAHYDFLLAISDRLGGIGLEHHQSSENGVRLGYFTEWAQASAGRDLLSHEFTHSWNGKFRRPADLWTPNTNTPMQDSLLWMYEGQTQFWGRVLAARAGLVPMNDSLDSFASTAAWVETRAGRAWRNLQDTTNEPVMEDRHDRDDWRDWQRSADYYDEMAMVWLEADMLIRDESKGARSLDDFARAFLGPQPERQGNGAQANFAPLTYTFNDLVAALNQVQPYDWARFLRDRLDTHRVDTPLAGLTRAGWRLVWAEAPSAYDKGAAARRKYEDFGYSLGFNVGKDDMLTGVYWNSPAFNAGLSAAAQLIAVDGRSYKPERLRAAITAAKTSKAPIQLLVKDGDLYKTVSIPYSGGLRYPKLERIDGVADRLTPLLSPKG